MQKYRYKNIEILIQPGVFSPKLTISTKILLRYIESLDLKNKSLLELGAGSGILSFYAESIGATVAASDISKSVINGLNFNKERLDSSINIIKSNLFEEINSKFDYIIINPPYYPRNPKNESEKAWFCGEHFEYFTALFKQLNKAIHNTTNIYMILSEDCNIPHIQSIGIENNYRFNTVLTKTKYGELNYIFSITKN